MAALARLLDPIAPPACVGCGSHAGRSEPLCARCRAAVRWLGGDAVRVAGVEAWATVAYDGPARAIVAALKFRGAVRLARTIAAQIAATAPGGWLDRAVLVPVPLPRARRRRRGFNQAEEIAWALAERTGSGVSDCLERAAGGETQVGLGRAERARALDGAIGVRPGALVPARAMLVDDVITTGATLGACAAALRAAGVMSVSATAYARTPGR